MVFLDFGDLKSKYLSGPALKFCHEPSVFQSLLLMDIGYYLLS